MEDDTLIHYPPKGDFEKLIFAEAYIKSLRKENDRVKEQSKLLRQEIGILKSEVDELQYNSSKSIPAMDADNIQIELASIKSTHTQKHKVSDIKSALDRFFTVPNDKVTLSQLSKKLKFTSLLKLNK